MLALAPLPRAMALSAEAVATGPMATLSVPVAVLSPRTELLWKYLIPAPLVTMLPNWVLKLLPRLVIEVLRLVPRSVTEVLVAFNWLPLTASVLVALKVPAATLVKVVAVPPWLKVTEVLVLTSSYLTPTAAVLARLLLRPVRAAPTLLLVAGALALPAVSMVVVL
ncbi:hypothetical protein [Pseudomonas sp. 25 R 14]|nr:hypothetical protein [Pseudomonas sp. 25 R 14]